MNSPEKSVNIFQNELSIFKRGGRSKAVADAMKMMQDRHGDIYLDVRRPELGLNSDIDFGMAVAYVAYVRNPGSNLELALNEFLGQCRSGENNLYPGINRHYQEKYISGFEDGARIVASAVKFYEAHAAAPKRSTG